MKTIYPIFTALLVFVLAYSCQNEEAVNAGVGYLRMDIETIGMTNPHTKVAEDYNPKQLAVEIVNSQNVIVESTDDYTLWAGKQLKLASGVYKIKASSNNFDGLESGFDIPYYYGETQVTIEEGKENTASITCTLANVKVTVKFDESFVKAFNFATATVSSALQGVASQAFVMGETSKSAYFPVDNLTSEISVVNKNGQTFSQSNEITDVKARDHYILNYKVAGTGDGSIKIETDGTETTYTFEFPVSTEAKTSLMMQKTNPWSTVAYVFGGISSLEEGKTIDPSKMFFEYKTVDADEWQIIPAVQEGENYKAMLTALNAATTYQCRMAYKNDTESYTSNAMNFTTEKQNKIPNLSFDAWVKSGKNYYANESVGAIFWDSGNKGANTLKEINPTKPEETDVVKGKAAKLWSTTAANQFAAGSLFTGVFGSASVVPLGAKLNFGQPFTERPTQLTGYFKYAPGTVTHTKKDFIAKGDRDSCFVYIALAEWSTPFAVSTGDDVFVDFTDSSIIAYGELDKELCSPETAMTAYQSFTIDIKYRDLNRKPTYILIVCTSSKYGDYFTGSTSSVLLLDEFDLKYGEPSIDPKYIQ